MSSVRSGREGVFDPSYVQRGEAVGPYRILERLGQGGMGATYLAEREGGVYALKLATFEREMDPEERSRQVARVKREAGILQQLDHPNIVRTYELGFWPSLEKGYPYIVMDYIEGARITDWRRQVVPSARMLSSVFAKLCRGLEELHRLGIYHRDLKGANVMVRAIDNEPIIIDFGIARAASARTVTRHLDILGTYVNFPPEYCEWASSGRIATEQFEHTAVQELWTVGLLAYELYTGHPPFPYRQTQYDMYEAIQRMTPPAPSKANPQLPPALDAIIMGALEKDPSRRCPSAATFAEELEEALRAADSSWDSPLPLVPVSASGPGSFIGSEEFSLVSSGPAPKSQTRAERHRSPSGQVAAGGATGDGPPSQDAPVSAELSLSALGFVVASEAGAGDDAPPSVVSSAEDLLDEDDAAGPPSVVSRVAAASEASDAPASAVSQVVHAASTPARSVAPPAFVPPSIVQQAETAFVAPEEDQVHQSAVAQAPQVPSAVRRMAEQLQGGGRSTLKLPTPVLIVGALVLICGGILGLARMGTPTEAPMPASSLDAMQFDQRAELLPREPVRAAPQAALPSPLPSPEMSKETPAEVSAEEEPARVRAPRRRNADEVGVDAILKENFGGARPVITASGQVVAGDGAATAARAAPKRIASFIKTGQASELEEQTGADAKIGVPFGAHIPVRLSSPLHSDTVRNGMVEARFVRPFRNRAGAILIPAHSTIYGSAQPDGTTGRFNIAFSRLRLPDNTILEVELNALDTRDSLPGLRALRTTPTGGDDRNVMADLAGGAAQTVLSTVTGGTGQDVMREAGQTLTREATKGGKPGSGPRDTLLLSAGLDFRVVAKQAF